MSAGFFVLQLTFLIKNASQIQVFYLEVKGVQLFLSLSFRATKFSWILF